VGAGPDYPWWSEAVGDPWRDPAAPAAVVVTPPPVAPELEAEPDPRPPRRGLGLVLVVSVVSALLAGALGGALGYVFAARNGGLGTPTTLGRGSAPPLTNRAPDSLAAVARRVLPSVVTIRARAGAGASVGSGFIATGDGYVITNDHVVSVGGGTLSVTFSDGNVASAKLVGSDPQSDVAVLKVDQSGLPAVQFGDSDQVQVGDPVLAVGSPLALPNTVTSGIVSALDRPIQATESGGPVRYYAAIQTDAAVNQGNSGGPLFDAAGRVVGINSVIKSLAADAEQAGNVGLAFAIPVNQAKRQAQEIIDTGRARRTVFGAQVEGGRTPGGGARLQSVETGGPAERAGLKVGDVVLRIDGRTVEEPADLIALVRKYAPGTPVRVDYTRSGAKATAQVTLAADAK
jgi:putative serine protease PepD